MKNVISSVRYQQAQDYEKQYWVSRQQDAVGIIHDLESIYSLSSLLQSQGYLKHQFQRMIDVGCGGLGIGILPLIHADECFGLDPLNVLPPETGSNFLDEFISAVQENTKYLVGEAESMPFENGFFDFIVCNNVIDHVHDPFSILVEIKRVLSPNGLFAFAVDTHSLRTLIYKKILKRVTPNFGSIPGHPYEWGETKMTEILKKSGFAIESHVPRSKKGRLLGKIRRTTWLLRHA